MKNSKTTTGKQTKSVKQNNEGIQKDGKTKQLKKGGSVDPEHMEKVAMYIGAMYRQSKIRVDLATHGAMYDIASPLFQNDCAFIASVDKALVACHSEHQQLLRRQYFEDHEPKWYLVYYTETSFKRKLKQALAEFFAYMKIDK